MRAWRPPRAARIGPFGAVVRADRGQHLPDGGPRPAPPDRTRDLGRGTPRGWRAARVRGSPHDGRTADLDLLERALDRISVADRTLLALHHFEHFSLDEIGARLGVPARTVKSRLFTARRSLERASRWNDDEPHRTTHRRAHRGRLRTASGPGRPVRSGPSGPGSSRHPGRSSSAAAGALGSRAAGR